MRKCVLMFVLAILVAIPTFAQPKTVDSVTDHWASAKECLAATGPYYVPRVKNAKPVKKGEQIIGYEWGGCFDMDLTSSEGGRGWVRLPPGSRVIVDTATAKPLRLEECNNHIYGFEPFLEAERSHVQAPPPAPPSLTGADLDRAAAHLSDAIAKAAAELKPAPAPPPQAAPEPPPSHPWYSWHSKTGKILYPVIGAAAGVGVYCGVTGNCYNEQTVIIIHK